jgi:hypothetical protein
MQIYGISIRKAQWADSWSYADLSFEAYQSKFQMALVNRPTRTTSLDVSETNIRSKRNTLACRTQFILHNGIRLREGPPDHCSLNQGALIQQI